MGVRFPPRAQIENWASIAQFFISSGNRTRRRGREEVLSSRIGDYSEPRVLKAQFRTCGTSSEIPSEGTIRTRLASSRGLDFLLASPEL